MSRARAIIDLRPGGPRDVPLVDRIMAAAFDPRFGEAWTQSQCIGMLTLPGVWLTLAEADGVPAGFALARIIADEAELLLIATVPQLRGHGVGGALLRAVMAEAREASACRIHLEVRGDNPAIRLYAREGFVKVGERRDYYRGNDGIRHDAHSFARDLDDDLSSSIA